MRNPQNEDPVNSVKDLINRNISVLEHSNIYDSKRKQILELNSTDWSIVAENMRFYEDDCCCTNSTPVVMAQPFCQPEYKELLYMVGFCRNPEVINDNELEGGCHTHSIRNLIHGNRTHALVKPFLDQFDFLIAPEEEWWRSKEYLPMYPYSGFKVSTDWILKEVAFSLTSHMLSSICVCQNPECKYLNSFV